MNNKLGVLSLLTIIFLLAVWTKRNIDLANEAKEVEESNQEVVYSYDRNNDVISKIESCNLVTEKRSPISVDKNDSEWFILFDQTYFGTLEIDFLNPLEEDRAVSITTSEKSLNGKAWTREDADRILQGNGITYYSIDLVIPKGTSKYRLILPERPLPSSSVIGGGWKGGVTPFCCCTILGLPDLQPFDVNFYQIAVHVPFNDAASKFISNNEFLNEVYEFCKETIKATTYAGVYVDGYRELRPYEADAYINEIGHFSVDKNYEIAKTTLKYFTKNHTWPTEWILQTIPLAYEYYMYSGDIEFIKEIFPDLQKCLLEEIKTGDGLLDSSLASNNLIESFGISAMNDIIDWPQTERDGFFSVNKKNIEMMKRGISYKYRSFIAGIAGCYYAKTIYDITADGAFNSGLFISSPNSVVNAFYYHSLNEMSFLAKEIGREDLKKKYDEKAELFKSVFQENFIDSSGLVKDSLESSHSSLHANMFALDFGLVPSVNEETVIDYIKSKGMACSVYGAQYLLESMLKFGESQYAIDLMIDRGKRSWYNMIYRTGSKLATEAWDEDIKPNMDWNHAWGTAPVNIITRYLVGVRPETPGCETMIFEPNFGNLTDCHAIIPINSGSIEISYEFSEGCIKLLCDSDSFIKFIPPLNSENLSIDGIIQEDNTKDLLLKPGIYKITYSVKKQK